jgi:hypothetical protein
MRVWIALCWMATLVCLIVAGHHLNTAMTLPGISAVQQAGECAIGVLWVIIPYVFTRAMQGIYDQFLVIDRLPAAESKPGSIPTLAIDEKQR